ncbi:MAG: hypothetical protein ACSW8C_01710 [bacterium]
MLEKIKAFFKRAPQQTPEQNLEEASTLQATSQELVSQVPSSGNNKELEDSAKKLEAMEAKLQQLISENQRLEEEKKQAQQKLAELSAGGAQKPERDLMQLLDSAQFTFIESDLFSLIRNESPGQETNGVPAPSDPNGTPVPPSPPPPPAPNGVPPPPPAPGTVNPISIKKAIPKAVTDFLDVVAKCRNFVENGYQIGDTIIHSKKEFEEQKGRLDAEVKVRKAENAQNLELIEGFKKKIEGQCSEWLRGLESSSDISAKELSDLRVRYGLSPELFLKDVDQLKALGLINENTYEKLISIRDEMKAKKGVLSEKLGIYLAEQKSIEAREREINRFKLPLPNANTAPYLNEVLQLLALKEKLDGYPEEQKKIEALLSKDLSQEVKETLDKNQARIAELEHQIKQTQSTLESRIDSLRKDPKYSSVMGIYDTKGLSFMLIQLKNIDKSTFEEINKTSEQTSKMEQEKESLSVSIKSELKKAIREANTALRKAKEAKK